MSFKFRFQQILEICLHEENEVKGRLAKKDGQIAETNLAIKKFKDDYSAALEQQMVDLQAGDIMKVQMYPNYLKMLQRSWEYQEEELERLEKQRQKIVEELLEKQRNRKTYEKMRENDEEHYKKEMLKREQRKLDEYGNRQRKGPEESENA